MEHLVYVSPGESKEELWFNYSHHLEQGNNVLTNQSWNKLLIASRREDESKLRELRKQLRS